MEISSERDLRCHLGPTPRAGQSYQEPRGTAQGVSKASTCWGDSSLLCPAHRLPARRPRNDKCERTLQTLVSVHSELRLACNMHAPRRCHLSFPKEPWALEPQQESRHPPPKEVKVGSHGIISTLSKGGSREARSPWERRASFALVLAGSAVSGGAR